jgi:hypothetical protein
MNLDRIQQGSSATITATLTVGTVATDPAPDSATVQVRRADGTVLIATTAANDSGTGVFSFPLTPTHTDLLDLLTATWTFTQGGQVQNRATRHEVVGGFLCSLPELAAVLVGKPDAELAAARVKIEQRLEKELGYACVPRYALEPRTAGNGIVKTRLPLRAVRSVTVDGIAWAAGQIAALRLEQWCACGIWTCRPVTIGYEHGRDAPDSDITEAALLLADEAYGSSIVDGRVVRQEADNMAVTYASPGRGPFIGARLNRIVHANALPAIA